MDPELTPHDTGQDAAGDELVAEDLVEEVSIDGMCAEY